MVWFRCLKCGEWLEVSAGYAKKPISEGGFDRTHKTRALLPGREHWPQFVSCGGRMIAQTDEERARFCRQWGTAHPTPHVEIEPPRKMKVTERIEAGLAAMGCRAEEMA